MDRKKVRTKPRFAAGKLTTSAPGLFGTHDFGEVARRMVGARVLAVGFHPKAREEGGFAIDFQHEGRAPERLVLGYNDLGEWEEYLGPRR